MASAVQAFYLTHSPMAAASGFKTRLQHLQDRFPMHHDSPSKKGPTSAAGPFYLNGL
jgi:hypothetical protein